MEKTFEIAKAYQLSKLIEYYLSVDSPAWHAEAKKLATELREILDTLDAKN